MSCGVKFAKFMLIFFNSLFFLTGCCLLAIGLWVRLDSNVWEYVEVVDVDGEDPMIEYATYFIMAIGAVVLITGFLGCCGAMRESRCMLGGYVFMLVVVLLAEIAVGVIVLIYRDKLEEDVIDTLQDSFEEDYKYKDGDWSGFAKAMNLVQRELECCGIEDRFDYVNVDASKVTVDSDAPRLCVYTEGELDFLPASCFKVKNSKKDEDHDKLQCDDIEIGKFHDEGCKDELVEFMERYAVIFTAIALGFACLQIFGLIFAICLCRLGGKGE